MNATYPAFLASEFSPAPVDAAHFVVIPVPFEQTVSYGTGTRGGPLAILTASQQLEACLDGIPGEDPGTRGIATLSPVPCEDPSLVVDLVGERVTRVLANHAVPVVLGGEHTVTLGALRAFAARGTLPGLIQFDAHADLRDSYEGRTMSHACVMRRALSLGYRLVQFGVREFCREESLVRSRYSVVAHDAWDLANTGIPTSIVPQDFPQDVYITFDVDCFDASLMPATGTPSPGGLFWNDVRRIVTQIAHVRHIVGFDVVELAPLRGFHAADFTAAKLTYLLMGLSLQS